MSNTERVNLDINIQLYSLRKAFQELKQLETKVKDIETGKTSSLQTNNSIIRFREYENKINKERLDKSNNKTNENIYLKSNNNQYLAAIEDRRAKMAEFELQRKAGIAEYEASEASAAKAAAQRDQARVQQQVNAYEARRKIRIDEGKAGLKEAEVEVKEITKLNAKAAADSKRMWTDSIKQAFSLHIIQMYVQPFVNALNQLLRTTLTTFAEFDRYYADYLAKSMDFQDKVGRAEIFAGGINQVYSISNMADAMERFSASGIDLTKNQQALTDVLQLSVTAGISYDDAANSVIKTQEAFQLSINDSTMIVDALTNAANASTAELKDLSEWFGYASGMSHEAGINVQQLAAYLGILSSMGMKSAGTAFRQMLVQLTQENVRTKLEAAFGQEFDFLNMDETLASMREYVQASSNQAETIQKISSALGGKVNAREALTRLLTADEETWNRIMGATERSGTAAALFDSMTDNAAGNLDKVKNNITIILTQIGQVFSPLLKVLATVTGWAATFINTMPTFSKYMIGGLTLLAGAVAMIMTLLVSLVGLFYMSYAANNMFEKGALKSAFSIKLLTSNMLQLSSAIVGHISLTNQAAASQQRLSSSIGLSNVMTRNMKMGMLSGIGAMASYMGYQYALEEQSYNLARALSALGAAFTGLMIGTAIGGPLGAIVGLLAGAGIGYSQQKSISRAEQDSTISKRNAMTYGKSDLNTYTDTGAKNYFNISTMNVNAVQSPDALASELLYASDY